MLVLTTSRADFGIYRSVLRAIEAHDDLSLGLAVTGMHLKPEFGNTIDEVKASGFPIDDVFECLGDEDDAVGTARDMGMATQNMGAALAETNADILMVLGDRFEMAACALAAVPFLLPIVHLHGGEETEGAIDNVFRHALTKLSHLHCCATELAASRIRQMGEPDSHILVSGAPALDSIADIPRLSREELDEKFGLPKDRDFALITYHPETMDGTDDADNLQNIIKALEKEKLFMLFTAANADSGGAKINAQINAYVKGNADDALMVLHMGAAGYYSAMANANFMIGNTSSGILEAASVACPVINIGDRQKGRERSGNTLDVKGDLPDIEAAMDKISSPAFQSAMHSLTNVYGNGNAAGKIADFIVEFLGSSGSLQKSFQLREST